MIRLMETGDVPAVCRIEEACFSWERWHEKTLAEGLKSPFDVYLVCEEDGAVCGYVNLRILSGEGELERIAVLPAYRRRGLAGQLLSAAIACAEEEGAGPVCLEVRRGNTAALRLYSAFGFRPETVRKNYYHEPTEDALIMWRRGEHLNTERSEKC